MNKKALKEALKEVGRLVFFAALTAVVAWGSEQIAGYDPSSGYYVIGTLVLRAIDKFIHANENTEMNGLAPF